MKNIFWIIAAAFAFVACSDDDGPREKPFDGEVVSFEASEHLLDAMTGNDVKLGPVTMSLMGMGDYTYANAFCAKQYAVEADFDGMLFSTADQNLIFNAYYSSLAAVLRVGGRRSQRNGNLCRILRFQLADGNVSRIPE